MKRWLSPETRLVFDELLEKQLARLPEDVKQLLDEVPLIVEDEPSLEVLREAGIEPTQDPSDLCGLHWGTPLSEKSVSDIPLESDRILIFRGPILRLSGGEKHRRALEKQIRITLLHELGHHFGLTEERLERLGFA